MELSVDTIMVRQIVQYFFYTVNTFLAFPSPFPAAPVGGSS